MSGLIGAPLPGAVSCRARHLIGIAASAALLAACGPGGNPQGGGAPGGAPPPPEVGVVTVWERPTRVIVTAAFLLGAALYRSYSTGASAAWATDAGWAWVALGVVGLVQLTVVVRRRLR